VHGVQLPDLGQVRLGQHLDLRGQLIDLRGVVVDEAEHHCQDRGVLFGQERAVQGFFQPGDLASHAAAGQLGQHLGVTFPGDDRLQHGPARDPVDVRDHR